MKPMFMFTVLGLAAAGLLAQGTAPIEVVSVPGAVPSGASRTALVNTSGKTVTAVAYSHPLLSASAAVKTQPVTVVDSAVEPTFSPILPGQAALLERMIPHAPGQSGPAAVAVLFEDGSAWGDNAFVERVVTRRKYMLQRLTESMADLQAAKAAAQHGADRKALSEQLRSAMASASASAADGVDQLCIRASRLLVIENIEKGVGSLSAILNVETDMLNQQLVKLRSFGNVQ